MTRHVESEQGASSLQTFVWPAAKLVIASLCLAIGICLFVECGLGSDPIDVLLDGLNRTFGISLGQANLALNATVFIIGLLVNRAAIGAPSVVGAVLGSLFVDVINVEIAPLDLASQSLVVRIAALLAGQLALCACYGIMQTIPHGSNLSDALVQWVPTVAPGSYTVWRMVYDGLCLIGGALLGGVFGAGTVLSVLTTGAITRLFARGVRATDHVLARSGAAHEHS